MNFIRFLLWQGSAGKQQSSVFIILLFFFVSCRFLPLVFWFIKRFVFKPGFSSIYPNLLHHNIKKHFSIVILEYITIWILKKSLLVDKTLPLIRNVNFADKKHEIFLLKNQLMIINLVMLLCRFFKSLHRQL